MILNRKKNKINSRFSDKAFNTFLLIVLSVWLLIVLYPLVYIVSSSFSSGNAVTTGQVLLWPVDFSLTGYEIVLEHKAVWTGYANTILYTFLGTFLDIILAILVAYPLSRSDFHGKVFFTALFMIPMFFGGGLIPTYLVVSKLGLVNTRLWMILVSALNISYVIILRTAFKTSIPRELLESAKLDGISDVGYLVKIVLPLSKATISVIILYYLVSHWNSYFSAMIYLSDREKYPLQLVLREILNASKVDVSQISDAALIAKLAGASDVMKYSLIVISTVPMLIIYPFVQKFFEKGVMIGSVKG